MIREIQEDNREIYEMIGEIHEIIREIYQMIREIWEMIRETKWLKKLRKPGEIYENKQLPDPKHTKVYKFPQVCHVQTYPGRQATSKEILIFKLLAAGLRKALASLGKSMQVSRGRKF